MAIQILKREADAKMVQFLPALFVGERLLENDGKLKGFSFIYLDFVLKA